MTHCQKHVNCSRVDNLSVNIMNRHSNLYVLVTCILKSNTKHKLAYKPQMYTVFKSTLKDIFLVFVVCVLICRMGACGLQTAALDKVPRR